MNVPAVVILFPLGAAPQVWLDVANGGEEHRLHEWLERHGEYAELVERARELAEEARAA